MGSTVSCPPCPTAQLSSCPRWCPALYFRNSQPLSVGIFTSDLCFSTSHPSFFLFSSFPWSTASAKPACCQALLNNLLKALQTPPVQNVTKSCPLLTLVLGGHEGAAHKRARSQTAQRCGVLAPEQGRAGFPLFRDDLNPQPE